MKVELPSENEDFQWLMAKNKILTDNLVRRGWLLFNMCFMCRSSEETVSHLFDQCSFARQMYQLIPQRISGLTEFWIRMGNSCNYINVVRDKHFDITNRSIFAITHFIIWRERCNRIFKRVQLDINNLIEQLEDEIQLNRKAAAYFSQQHH
jgi:zinc-binding in reverse transcriptase